VALKPSSRLEGELQVLITAGAGTAIWLPGLWPCRNHYKIRLFHNSPRQDLVKPSVNLNRLTFEVLKEALCAHTVLVPNFDPDLPLLYYVDSSREAGDHQIPRESMNAMTVEDILNGKHDRRLERPVMYLSRLLNRHEVNYCPTELEIVGIVWAVQKTRHLIEGTSHVKIGGLN
jgi:RNase H-like domain found in reverse transcriptase